MAQSTVNVKLGALDVTKMLRDDHQKMRQLMAQLKTALEVISHQHSSEALQTAQITMKKLVQKLRIHSTCEDQVLFHAIGKYHPLQAVEAEHAEVAVIQAALITGILNYTFPEDCSNLTLQKGLDFISLLERHFQMEEDRIFPLAAGSLSPDEKLQVLQEIKNVRARERKVHLPALFSENDYHKFRVFMTEPVQSNMQIKSLLDAEGIQVRTLEIKAGSALPEQVTGTQLFFLISGEALWQGPQSSLLLQPGEGFLLEAHIPYTVEAITDCRLLSILLKI